MKPPREKFVVEFEAAGQGEPPAIVRVRALVKRALRTFGLRVTALRSGEGTPIAMDEPESTAQGASNG